MGEKTAAMPPISTMSHLLCLENAEYGTSDISVSVRAAGTRSGLAPAFSGWMMTREGTRSTAMVEEEGRWGEDAFGRSWSSAIVTADWDPRAVRVPCCSNEGEMSVEEVLEFAIIAIDELDDRGLDRRAVLPRQESRREVMIGHHITHTMYR